jgi:hypothetical protein
MSATQSTEAGVLDEPDSAKPAAAEYSYIPARQAT